MRGWAVGKYSMADLGKVDGAAGSVGSPGILRDHFGWLDDHGPEQLWGVIRYPEYPEDTDWSDAFLDPLSEAIGRYVRVCSGWRLRCSGYVANSIST